MFEEYAVYLGLPGRAIITRKPKIVLIQKIKVISRTRVRYGYRMIHILLSRESIKVNHKRVYRLYCQTGLQLRDKIPRRRAQAQVRQEQVIAYAPRLLEYGFYV